MEHWKFLIYSLPTYEVYSLLLTGIDFWKENFGYLKPALVWFWRLISIWSVYFYGGKVQIYSFFFIMFIISV